MKKILAVVKAFTGYAGSSESPEKVSMRFMGIAMGIVSQFAPLVSSFLPFGIEEFVKQTQPVILLVACLMWTFGAVKAMWLAAKASPTVGAFLKK